jgi:hypothetical protein
MECVSYFLLIWSKKTKRHIGYFYPNITLKNLFETKKNRRNASVKILHSHKQILYDIHFFSHTVEKKIVKWKMFTRTSPFKVDILKKSRCKLCQFCFDRNEQILDEYQLSNSKFHLTSRA